MQLFFLSSTSFRDHWFFCKTSRLCLRWASLFFHNRVEVRSWESRQQQIWVSPFALQHDRLIISSHGLNGQLIYPVICMHADSFSNFSSSGEEDELWLSFTERRGLVQSAAPSDSYIQSLYITVPLIEHSALSYRHLQSWEKGKKKKKSRFHAGAQLLWQQWFCFCLCQSLLTV